MKKRIEDLVAGDWILWKYGLSHVRYYVLGNSCGMLTVGNPRWCVSSAMTNRHSDMHDWAYIGHTQPRWFWKFLPWRDVVCPVGHLPIFL